MDYPHIVTISRPSQVAPGGGTQDAVDGVYVDNPALPDTTVVYEGRADVQDKGEALDVDTRGLPTLMSDGVIFLRDERKITGVNVNDLVSIKWEDGTSSSAQVMRIRRFDSSILVRRIIP